MSGSGFAAGTRRAVRNTPVPVLYLVLAVLVILPMFFVALAAFANNPPRPGSFGHLGLTVRNFVAIADSATLKATVNSLIVGVGASILALLIGGFLAFLTARTNVFGRRFLFFVGLVPMFLPSYVGAMAWDVLAGPHAGLLNILGRDLGTHSDIINIQNIGGLIFVLGIYYAPYSFLLVNSSFSLMSAELEEAARVHGARGWETLRRVTLPLALPAIVGSAVLIFALTVENFPVALIIGSVGGVDTLPTYVFRLMNGNSAHQNQAAAVSVVLVLVVVIVTILQRRIIGKRNYTTVAGKGVRAGKIDLGWARVPSLIFGIVYFCAAAVLPILALAFMAFHTMPYVSTVTHGFTTPGTFSLKAFSEVLRSADFTSSAVNSVVVSILAALFGTLLAFVLAYIVNRTKLRGRSGLEYVAMLPLSVPTLVLGVGLLWTWLVVPLPIYGTLAVLIVAFLAAQAPQGFRGIASSILQVDRDLEDSAVMHGASRVRATAAVTVPLMRVGLTSTFLLLLMLSMRELTVALFLFTTSTRLLSIVIFNDYDNGVLQTAAATSLIYCVIIFILAFSAQRLGARERL